MDALITDAWNEYNSFQQHDFVVKPSIPILFFGDSKQYEQSKLRVVTVGLNPSKGEFHDPSNPDPFVRFEDARNAYPGILDGGKQHYSTYLSALNNYFHNKPYAWFRCFEPILQGFDCSYYGARANTALHTDLCSPLATNPTWSTLLEPARAALQANGVAMWHKLVGQLLPDVIVISVARQHLSRISFRMIEPVSRLFTILETTAGEERKKPYHVEAQRVQLTEAKTALLVFGEAAHTPFGTVSKVDKERIGAAMGRRLMENKLCFVQFMHPGYSYTKPWSTLKTTLKSGVTTVPCGCTAPRRRAHNGRRHQSLEYRGT